ncbi:MAG: TlpA family protein disulfide reductase [Phycisphaerales bacterium]|nr:TlpA family protein disulfide reductase [Phycisphaerales bacterium]
MLRRTAFTFALLLASTTFGQTDAFKSLTIGDPAPSIDIAHWVTGEPVKELESGRVYIIEFWSTRCGPCLRSMPHISEVQQHYGDKVTVISVSDEDLATVTGFLAKDHPDGGLWADIIKYRLTTDPDQSVKNDYFRAAGQRGIPTAFIVGKDTRIEWIGHPMRMEEPLEAVVTDQWDRKAFTAEWEKKAVLDREMARIDRVIRKAYGEQDWETVIKTFDELIVLDEEQFGRYRIDKMMLFVKQLGDPQRAWAVGREAMELNWDDAQMLNGLAWSLVDDTGITDPDLLALAMEAGRRASDLTDDADASTLDTVARVFLEQGAVCTAIVWQERAVKHAQTERERDALGATLKKYQDAADERSDT